MLMLPLQYDTHRGPDAVGQHKLTFTLDESVASDFNPMSIKKGTQFLVMLVQADTKEANDFVSETKEETVSRFKKHLEALLSEMADMQDVDRKEYREIFKQSLIKQGIIKSSTNELSLEELSKQIIKLKEIKQNI